MRVERCHKFTVWTPNVGDEVGAAEVAPTEAGVCVSVGEWSVELDDLDAVARHHALASWMARRGASENEPTPRAEGRG